MPPSKSLLSFIFFYLLVAVGHSCTLTPNAFSRSSCPPFTSTPPFPFSVSPGCGHPSFQLKCSSPYSIISINNVSFSLLSFEPNSSSLTLSPQPHSFTTTATTTHTRTNCSAFSIPTHSIDLSGSPFKFSESDCSRLSVVRSCSVPNLPNCSHCPWECRLIKNPVQLLHGCVSYRLRSSQQGCQSDILEYVDQILTFGLHVEYDESQDSYFTNCRECKSKNGICGFNSSDPEKQFICFLSKTRFSPKWIHEDDANRIAILCSVFAVVCLLFVLLVIAAIYRSRRIRSLANEEDPTILFLHRHRSASLLPPVFTYDELEISTNHFDPKRKIGDGGFGSVYLGHLYDGRIVAVKYLHKHHHSAAFSTKSFCNEILILSSIDHPNLVKLHGYCSDPRGLLLVYDYVPNGTLFDHLHGLKNRSLTWQVRLDIALQTALALEYLHFAVQPAIVHRDITSSNIFVEKDMRIKVGDFGLSRLLVFSPSDTSSSTSSSSSGYVWTGPQGTPGYLDPDYHRSFRLTEKSDVYSFGVVLLELISGLKAVDQSRDKREMALADLVVSKIQMGQLHQVVDPLFINDGREGGNEGIEAVAELAFRCVAADKDDRPDAKEVVEELKRIRSRTRGLRGSNNSNNNMNNGAGGDVAKG
ncbi:kinase, putative [Ricinus communis]|uniref:Kinase, putative n=1 Tax=Ricinus communis TaxID=3988 RepID=B9S2E5_RICCO|nr:kinase, putative [Ricinus communis]|eukprot:XP_002520164.1 LEAF RUST 10 DISEASE-RESISTANCE LOCUS RECEPTOR-LIKE PROTEIN KINASE-like 1.5 [Ricinus communis]